MVSIRDQLPFIGQWTVARSYASRVQLPQPRSAPRSGPEDPAGPVETPAAEPTPTETTRDRILRTARDLFAQRGYQRTSLQQIADQLRLTKAAILYHFPSKEHLVAALLEPLIVALEQAVDAADGHPPPLARWVFLEAWVDAMLAHRRSLGMLLRDVSVLTAGGMYPRFMSLAMRAYAVVAGPNATLAEQVRAVQAVAALGDPVVFFDDVPETLLREQMLAGVRQLLGDPAPVTGNDAEATGADAEPGRSAVPRPAQTAKRRRAGRPAAMDAARISAARAMYATGAHSVSEIAAALGVSRATVYRHLRPSTPSQNSQ